MKKYLTPKNVLLLILLLAVIGLAIATAVLGRRAEARQKDMDALFTQSYNQLLTNARNGLLASTQDAFGPYDADNAKNGRLMAAVFPYTSYARDRSLESIVKLLNDWVGENRLYPEHAFADIPGQLFRDLFGLSANFDDTAATQAAAEALLTALAPPEEAAPEGDAPADAGA